MCYNMVVTREVVPMNKLIKVMALVVIIGIGNEFARSNSLRRLLKGKNAYEIVKIEAAPATKK